MIKLLLNPPLQIAKNLLDQWLKKNSLSKRTLTFEHLELFFKKCAVSSGYQRNIRRYLRLASADFPKLLLPGVVPAIAKTFINSLKIHLKPVTGECYSACIRNFYCFLFKSKITLQRFSRPQMLSFFLSLVEKGHSAGSRLRHAICLRAYLRWLYEQKLITVPPERLIFSTDFPKVPSLLPRPLPPDLDQKIQQRLKSSSAVFHQALLLMRHTGIRVGELIALPWDCVFVDTNNNKFLKVPLGKLNNERNVPLDPKTFKLLQTIQQKGPSNRQFLVPRNNLCPRSMRLALNKALHQVTAGLKQDAPIGTHRLRHTYATTLLTAGLSLPALSKLLGHKDFHMTLRYAAVTQESIQKQYFAALDAIKNRCSAPSLPLSPSLDANPTTLLDLVGHALKKLASDGQLTTSASAMLLKKIARLKQNVQSSLQDIQIPAKLAR